MLRSVPMCLTSELASYCQYAPDTLCHCIYSPIIVKLLALALTNLVLDLANLVTNLAKPSLD